jgi:hypothetical protein
MLAERAFWQAERQKQIGELGIAVLIDQPYHRVSLAPGARVADNRECRGANIR